MTITIIAKHNNNDKLKVIIHHLIRLAILYHNAEVRIKDVKIKPNSN